MQVVRDAVVAIHYTLKNDAGEVLDSSDGGEPLAYIQGGGNIIPGLEEALEGRGVGDKLDVSIPAEKAYGAHEPGLIQQACFAQLPALAREIRAEIVADADPINLV